MSTRAAPPGWLEAPAWLTELQGAFGDIIRVPLERTTGTLRAATETYDLSLGVTDGPRAQARDRLAVYHRQYWFRLFGVLQASFPLTARLLGFWHFNEFAAGFLVDHPPQGWDIGAAGDGFAPFLERVIAGRALRVGAPLRTVEGDLVVEAVRLDEVFRVVFAAPPQASFRPGPADAARLPSSRLAPSSSSLSIQEHWPLTKLRQETLARGDEAEVRPPARHGEPAFWAVFRTPGGIGQARLAPLEARLWELLRTETVERALALLEESCPEADRAGLPTLTQRFLARSVELSFWTGLLSGDDG